jgi:hypothetical protein
MEMTVTGSVRIPANCRGPVIGTSFVETENGGTKVIELKLLMKVADTNKPVLNKRLTLLPGCAINGRPERYY